MESEVLFTYCLYAVLAVYFTLLVMVAARRMSGGKQATQVGAVRVHDSKVEARHGADPSTIVGLFIIAASLLGAMVSLGIGLTAIDSFMRLPVGTLSAPGIFMLVFAGLALWGLCWSVWVGFGRWGVVVDGAGRSVLTWWGVVMPLRRRTQRLDDFTAVVIRAGKRRILSRARTFTIGLEGAGRPVLMDGTTCHTREQAQELAQSIAAVSGLPVQDQSQSK